MIHYTRQNYCVASSDIPHWSLQHSTVYTLYQEYVAIQVQYF